jgi:hypothetical protein
LVSDASAILDLLQRWDLTDVLDLKPLDDSIRVSFRTPISAHVCCRLPELTAVPLGPISATARVPLVYVQGIPPDTKSEDIRNFFKNIAPILKINHVKRETISVHILKFSSLRKALRVSETADRERFKGNALTVSHQYKSAITNCFFLAGQAPGSLTVASVRAEVATIGGIAHIFVNAAGPLKEVFVSMVERSDAKLACGVMNHRIYNGETVHAVFVDPAYFEDVREANDGA